MDNINQLTPGTMDLKAESLVNGTAMGPLLFSNEPLSFWGGIDPATGRIIDQHHPLSGKSIRGAILAMPCGRGSCTGSVAMLEILLNGNGPAALVFCFPEQILTLGVIVAKMLFDRQIPVISVREEGFALLERYEFATISEKSLVLGNETPLPSTPLPFGASSTEHEMELSQHDFSLLAGERGKAAKIAMKILLEFARVQGAKSFIDVTQVHIDCCIYVAPASTRFADYFFGLGDADFAVPTSMNSISIDRQRWQEIGIDEHFAKEADRLADAYIKMGASLSFTCAPYLLDTAPKSGEQIGWGESNAVVFANSVLGACTQKYPDFVDVCIALTGRAPVAGVDISENRRPKVRIEVPSFDRYDDSLFPLLGYCIGHQAGVQIPFVTGMRHTNPSISDLKAFGAAFATTASAPMFHIESITPEAAGIESYAQQAKTVQIDKADLVCCWRSLNTAPDSSLDLVALGNPHFAFDEFETLLALCFGKSKHDDVSVVVTTSRDTYGKIAKAGMIQPLEDFGVQVLSDTCWCMLSEPVVKPSQKAVMTNSGKYSHYAPGLVRRKVHFGSLRDCVDAAVSGRREMTLPGWLEEVPNPS